MRIAEPEASGATVCVRLGQEFFLGEMGWRGIPEGACRISGMQDHADGPCRRLPLPEFFRYTYYFRYITCQMLTIPQVKGEKT